MNEPIKHLAAASEGNFEKGSLACPTIPQMEGGDLGRRNPVRVNCVVGKSLSESRPIRRFRYRSICSLVVAVVYVYAYDLCAGGAEATTTATRKGQTLHWRITFTTPFFTLPL